MNDIWQENCKQLRIHFEKDSFNDFLQWSTIQATMFVGNAPYIPFELNELDHYLHAIEEPKTGNPTLFDNWTSGNLIHQMYHLKQWLDRTKQDLKSMRTIFEVGAGYGAMALICRRLGFGGHYYILDLPELQRIQEWYFLRTISLENVSWSIPFQCDLFIGLHSIGEMPLQERDCLISQMQAREYLFAYMPDFGHIDNTQWFTRLGSKPLDWIQYAHPYQENCMYQVGVEI